MAGRKRIALVAVVGVALVVGTSAAATIDAPFSARVAAVVGDCDNNGTADFSEASWANRDDDADGFCNGLDVCPAEASATNDSAACQMQAVTVPAKPGDPSARHATYSGATITLKGVARYGGNQFSWDFGDGSSPMAWTAIGSNPYDLGARHVYSGSPGTVYLATLSVRSSASPNVVATASYPLKIEDAGSNIQALSAQQFDVRRRMAIDEGLWYLHKSFSRSQFADGAPGYRQQYGYWSTDSQLDCLTIDAFEQNGSTPGGRVATDPYVEDVQRSLATALVSLSALGISQQLSGNPDTNGNGRGITVTNAMPVLATGRCLSALADSRAGDRQAATGGTNVRGLTYSAIARDMADWLAYAQEDSGSARGGWGYTPNSGTANNEMERWVILGLGAAESSLGVTLPSFVRQEVPFWLLQTRSSSNDDRNGSTGDFVVNDALSSVAFTAGGIIGDEFLGNSAAYARSQQSQGYIYRHWNDNDGVWRTNLGDSDAMYTVMRAMNGATPPQVLVKNYDYVTGVQVPGGFDWFRTAVGQTQQGIGTNLLARQATNGSWTDSTGITGGRTSGTAAITALDVAILQGTTDPEAPIASLGPTGTVGLNQQVQLDASSSASRDGSALTFAWDVNGDGAFTDATGAATTFSSPLYGTFPVCVRVTDGAGRTATACASITVAPGPHPPHAVQPTVYLGTVSSPVQLDASQSFDVDGDPITYAWDLDNDGQFDDATGATPTVTFASTGDFPVAVRVTDHPILNATPYNAPESSSTAFAVVQIGAHAPIANAGGPYTVAPGGSIQLDAGASSDPGGLQLTYAWDLLGNGLFTDSSAIRPVFSVGSVAAGTTYPVCVKVTNSAAKSNTSCGQVTVVAVAQPPVAQIVSPNQVVHGPLPVTVQLDASHSTDPQGRPLTFSWTVDDGGTLQNATSAVATHTVAHYGAFNATVTVDNGLLTSSATASVQVVDTTAPTFTTPPQNITLQAGPTTTASVAAWLAAVTAQDDDPDHPTATVAYDFAPNAGVGGVGAGNSVLVTWTATDSVGNAAQVSASVTVVGDSTAPVVEPVVTGTLGDNGWYTGDVHVSWQIVDPESAITARSGCAAADVTSDTSTAGLTFSCSATSDGGTSPPSTITIKRDATPPTITAARTPAANAAGWNAEDVTVTFSCGDDLSLVAQCSAPTVLHEGATQGATGTARDNAGNTASTTVSGVNVDRTGPSLTGTPASSPNLNGWYHGDVLVHWTCSDVLSGVDACPPDSGITGEGAGLTAAASVSDRAGNVTAALSNPLVRIDRTPPLTSASAPSGWTNDGVTVALSATDNLSGIAVTYYSLDGGPTTYGGSVVIDTEGPHTLTYWSVDGAENVEQTRSISVLIDRSAPTITHSLSPSPNAAGWNHGDVAVSFSCGDSLSGIASCTALQVLTSEGAGQHVAGQARDNAGNTADDSATVSIDRTAPSVTASADRVPNAAGWYGADVVVSFTCSDGLSGVAACPVAATVTEGAGRSASGTATDVAGNQGSTSLGGLDVDETAPVVTFAGNAGTYTIAQAVAITCSASDALSGVASTTCADISGPAASFGLGTVGRSASATDRAGNVGTGSVSFTVTVDCDAVKSVIRQWVSNGGIASALSAKVDAICAAPNANAKSGKLGAFDNQVAAQTGKTLTKEHADLLEQYAAAL